MLLVAQVTNCWHQVVLVAPELSVLLLLHGFLVKTLLSYRFEVLFGSKRVVVVVMLQQQSFGLVPRKRMVAQASLRFHPLESFSILETL